MTKISWVLYFIDLTDNFNVISGVAIGITVILVIAFSVALIAVYAECVESVKQIVIPMLKKTIKITLIVLFFALAVNILMPNKKTMQMILAVELTNYSVNETETGQQVKDIVAEGLDLLKNQLKDINKGVE